MTNPFSAPISSGDAARRANRNRIAVCGRPISRYEVRRKRGRHEAEAAVRYAGQNGLPTMLKAQIS